MMRVIDITEAYYTDVDIDDVSCQMIILNTVNNQCETQYDGSHVHNLDDILEDFEGDELERILGLLPEKARKELEARP